MASVTATASQHDNGASRPFAFLPKRQRSKSHPHTSYNEVPNGMLHDNDDTSPYPVHTTSESASTSLSQRHVFPTAPTATKHTMHIDIPQNALQTSHSHPIAPPTFIRKKSGELVKPSLKPTSSFATYPAPSSNSPSPSPSPAPSRLRTTSAPATPSASKSVHFDAQLEHVKLFLAGQKPLAVSREGSPVDMDTTSASEAEPDSFGISSYPFPNYKPKSRFGLPAASSSASSNLSSTRPQTQSRMKLKLIQIYTPMPPSNPAIEPWSFDVRVESVRLSNPDAPVPLGGTRDVFPTLHGTILVHNKAFTKTVFFRYTLDDWNTVSEVSCKHVHTLPGGIYDRFEYRVKLIGLATNRVEADRALNASGSGSAFGLASSRFRPPYRMEFCVRYNVPGLGEWWDSNSGKNYVIEFEWESESVSVPVPLSAQQQQPQPTMAKIVSPQPQRFAPNVTGASPLLQRLARHSLPSSSSGNASPGHISPPPYTGPGSPPMLDQRPPMPSPSFPPSFPSSGRSDYFNFNSNKPQAMNIPLRSRYDFGVSLREGAKITRPTVTSPPPSSAVASNPLSPTRAYLGLPPLSHGNEISLPTAARIMSPTPIHGQFKHAMPGKQGSQSPDWDEKVGNSLSSVEIPFASATSTGNFSPGSDSTIHPIDTSSYPAAAGDASLVSPSGRRHTRSWLRTSMSDQHVSSNDPWGTVRVRKTMSLPAGFDADEPVSPPSSQVNFQSHRQEQEQQHHLDGDEDDESEEDGIWFGRRSTSNSSGNGGNGAGTDVTTDATQSDYDIMTRAMFIASSPTVRFHDLDVVLEAEEAEQDDDGEDNEDLKDMEMGDSSSSSHSSSSVSSPTCSLVEMREENERIAAVTDGAVPASALEVMALPSSSSPSSTIWSLSSSIGGSSSSSMSTSSGVSFLPSGISTPSHFDSRTLPLFRAKLARAVLSGTPRSASPSLDGTTEHVEIMSLPPHPSKMEGPGGNITFFPRSVVMESPSSDEGSVTPKAEKISSGLGAVSSSAATAGMGNGAGLKGINLNSSSYYSLLNQFCFFTGHGVKQGQGQTQTQPKNQAQANVPVEQQARERSSARVALLNANATTNGIEVATDRATRVNRGAGQSRSSSAEPSYPSSSSSYPLSPEFGFNLAFPLDGFGTSVHNDTHHPFRPYGMLKSLGRSFSDPPETFSARSPYGEQMSESVS